MLLRARVARLKYKVKKFFIEWTWDKWCWLKTFNTPPSVTINHDLTVYSGDPPAIVVDGRVVLRVNGNVTLKQKTKNKK